MNQIGGGITNNSMANGGPDKLFDNKIYNVQWGGTSIADIKRKQAENGGRQKPRDDYPDRPSNRQPNRQPNRPPNGSPSGPPGKRPIRRPYPDEDTNRRDRRESFDRDDRSDYRSRERDYERDYEKDRIKHLVKDINRSLDDYAPSKSHATEDSEDFSEEKVQNTSSENCIISFAKETSLLVAIYVILSQQFVIKTIGEYMSYINPREDGSISIAGYISYGTLLALLFIFFRKVLIG